MGKNRTLSICMNKIPKDRYFKHPNGNVYLNISTYDLDSRDQFDNDFSVSLPLTDKEVEQKKNGANIKRIFIGNGKIWEDKNLINPASESDLNDLLPF